MVEWEYELASVMSQFAVRVPLVHFVSHSCTAFVPLLRICLMQFIHLMYLCTSWFMRTAKVRVPRMYLHRMCTSVPL